MNPANRQPSGDLGDLRVLARQHIELQLAGGFDGETGVLLSEPGALGLPRVSMPYKTNGDGHRVPTVESVCLPVMMIVSRNQKGTRSGVPGFVGYGFARQRPFRRPKSTWCRNQSA